MAKMVITPEAILSYPHLFEPRAGGDGQKAKYSCALIFTKEIQETPEFKAMKKVALEVAIEKYGDKAKSMIRSGSLRWPFRDDSEEKGYPEGSVFLNVRTERVPGIVSIYPHPETGKPLPITNEEEIYAGCIVRASLAAYDYNREGNKGITFGLNNVQKLRDCAPEDRLDGRKKAEDEFEADEDAVADLSDLTETTEAVEDDEDVGPSPNNIDELLEDL